MKISNAEIEVIHLSRNRNQCVLHMNEATLKQLSLLELQSPITSAGKQEDELDTRIDKDSAVMQALHYSVVIKRELLNKAKRSIFKIVFVPILIYGHESWVMTERVRSQVKVFEMRF